MSRLELPSASLPKLRWKNIGANGGRWKPKVIDDGLSNRCILVVRGLYVSYLTRRSIYALAVDPR